jgi:hypothetical protein
MNIIIYPLFPLLEKVEQKVWSKILDKNPGENSIYLLYTFYPLLKKVEQNPKKGCNEVRTKPRKGFQNSGVSS